MVRRYTMLGAVMILTVACGNGDDPSPGTAPETGTGTGEDVEGGYQDDLADTLAEGPQGDATSVEHHDGLTVRLATVERVPDDWAANVPSGHAVVRVTLELDNPGDQPIPLESPFRRMLILHGPNLTEAERAVGYMLDPGQEHMALSTDEPRQIGSGQTVEIARSFFVPETDLDSFDVESSIETERYPPYTFEGAHELLEDVS